MISTAKNGDEQLLKSKVNHNFLISQEPEHVIRYDYELLSTQYILAENKTQRKVGASYWATLKAIWWLFLLFIYYI